ncbi:hypothetical protein VTI74DRAFT_8693 [Chaetomium olivicolor]
MAFTAEYLPSLPSVLVFLLPLLLLSLYNLYLHPLAAYPGPLLSRALPFPQALRIMSGHGPLDVHELHERYGPVVRLGPNHLSYTDVRAWQDAYGHRTSLGEHVGAKENAKSKLFFAESLTEGKIDGGAPNILSADREEHSRLRRAMAAGFSEKAMRRNEGVIKGYVDKLVSGLKKRVEKGNGEVKLNIVPWFNWTMFDIVGDLVFAESFGCLEAERDHPFVAMILAVIPEFAWMLGLKYMRLGKVPVVRTVLSKAVQWLAAGSQKEMREMMGAKPSEEPETTASLLSGMIFLLLDSPDVMDKLKHEVRSSFKRADEITLDSVSRLPYMLACLNEGLRRYPPAVSNVPRDVHKGGAVIAGQFVPDDTIVEIQFYAMNHSSRNWRDPFAFRPEKWLDKVDNEIIESEGTSEEKSDGDRLEAMQSFSVGPRNCIGRNLAIAEMRLILARFILEFEFTLAEESKDWIKQNKVYSAWARPPLWTHLTLVKRDE